MLARSTTFEARPESIEAGVAYCYDEVMPALRGVDGWIGLSLLTDRESGRCILTTAWENGAAMQSSADQVRPLRDRLAEAFAEWLHQQARFQCGIEKPGDLTNEELIREKYRGIRPAPGYPAQPDHTEKKTLFALLNATENTGCELTDSYAMHPGASVSGLYFNHPEARYFGISTDLGKDQIEDYAARKGMTVAAVEKWLNPWLSY